MWHNKVGWDEPLNDDLAKDWIEIATDLKQSSEFSIKRCYFPARPTQPTIHCFADASQKAYGAIVFITDNDQVSFVLAKTRVAPLKQLTLPRLELMVALIATRLTLFAVTHIPLQDPPIFIWSDSQIVLHWVNSTKRLPTFVRNRVTEIQRNLPKANWRYCPTQANPADLLSRGTTTQVLMSSKLWQHGPDWLTTPSLWPSCEQPCLSPLLVAAATTTEFVPTGPNQPKVGLHCVISINRHSTLSKLLTVTAYVLRFAGNLRIPLEQRQTGPVSAKELISARLQWIKDTQQTVYLREIANLHQIAKQPSISRIMLVRQLRLFLDSKGYLRCGGRIHNAPLNEATKFPYLLPSKHPLSSLIILDIHTTLCHSGTGATLTALRQSYWIPAGRQFIKSLLRNCVICRKVSDNPFSTPDPAPLPSIRTQDVHPFTYTGVDFSGALYVRHGEEIKVYLCLFTCATTRALHLEIVQDLSTETFLLAFRKFAARRSLPTIMVSDNASTYLSAADELQSLMQSSEVKRDLAKRGVSWRFIPKRAPWWGGFWERMVGLTKSALKKVLGRRHISLITLETVIVEIEATLNDRPITFVSSDQGDLEPLTPAHLLHGRRITCLPHEALADDDELIDPTYGEVCGNAKLLATILQNFQKRWRHEYLTSLREVHKTTGSNHQTVRTGDVVLIHDDTPRATWKMGVVEELITGGDGIVRAVTLRTATGLTNRPVTRLYPLELNVTRQLEIEETRNHQGEEFSTATTESSTSTIPMGSLTSARPQRSSAHRATVKMKEWARVLAAPPGGCRDAGTMNPYYNNSCNIARMITCH